VTRSRARRASVPSSLPRFTRLTLWLIPWLFLASVELVLRLTPIAAPPRYFLEERSGDRIFLRSNPRIGERFFPKSLGAIIPAPNSQVFALQKPPGLKRVLCLGESTTAGFPFPVHGGFPALLEQILGERAGAGATRWEVVNCGLTGISSQVVAELMPDYLQAKPDLFVIYLGHNEFYGVGGVIGSSPLTDVLGALRRLRMYRVLESAVAGTSAAGSDDKNTEKKPGTLMERLAERSVVSPGDPARLRAEQRFEKHLESILRAADRAGVPVLLCELVSNEKDLYPFGSSSDPAQSAAVAFTSGDYRAARNLDTVPFRAPDGMNEVLREAATKSAAQATGTTTTASASVRFVELDSVFRSASDAERTLGRESFTEHLHPNFAGNARIAATVASAIVDEPHASAPTRDDLARWWRGSDLTRIDLAFADARLAQLHGRWPYKREGIDAPPAPYRFPPTLDDARSLLAAAGDSIGAARLATPSPREPEYLTALVQKRATIFDIHRALTRELAAAGDLEGARRELRAALRLYPVDDRIWMELAELARRDGALDEARWAARSALSWNPGAISAREFLATIGG